MFLKASPETIYERVKDDDKRPLLRCHDPLSRIKELMDSRLKAYEDAADIVVDTDNKTIEEVVGEIVDRLGIK